MIPSIRWVCKNSLPSTTANFPLCSKYNLAQNKNILIPICTENNIATAKK